MQYYVLPINRAYPSERDRQVGLVRLEQGAVGELGKIDRMAIVASLSSTLFQTAAPAIDCGLDGDGSIKSILYAYLSNPSLQYHLGLTHGWYGGRIIEKLNITETVEFNAEVEADLQYPAGTVLSKEWAGGVWDSAGNKIVGPALSLDGDTLSTTKQVYGAVQVEHIVTRHAYTLVIPPRNSVENVFNSWAWAVWDGGIEMKELQEPYGAEVNYHEEVPCWQRGQGGSTAISDPTPEVPGGYGNEHEQKIDYCAQQEIS